MPDGAGLTWHVAGRPLIGEPVSGDLAVIAGNGQRTLLAAIDGLGHGEHAAAAAECARDVLLENLAEPLEPLVVLCHKAMEHTRGAAMVVATIEHATSRLSWLGVGNVVGALVRVRHEPARVETVFQFPGVVGYRLPALHVPETTLEDGDLLVFATDGISPSFLDVLRVTASVQRLADGILAAHGREDDDALVLAAHYRRRAAPA